MLWIGYNPDGSVGNSWVNAEKPTEAALTYNLFTQDPDDLRCNKTGMR
jgi:hypothetical protein